MVFPNEMETVGYLTTIAAPSLDRGNVRGLSYVSIPSEKIYLAALLILTIMSATILAVCNTLAGLFKRLSLYIPALHS